MKKNIILAIVFGTGVLIYLLGFIFNTPIGRLLMIGGGLLTSITMFVFGRKIRYKNKFFSIFIIIFSALLFISIAIVFTGLLTNKLI